MNSFFRISERNSSIPREIIAGIVTFMTMVYIVCVQPQVMSGATTGQPTGMDASALITTTCLAAAFGSILLGIMANYPIALAPGMGENIFVVLTIMPVCAAIGVNDGTQPWQLALGVVFIAGVLFAVLSFCNVRKYLLNMISPSLRNAMAGGVGLLIAFIGLKNGGIVVSADGNLLLGALATPEPLVFCIGVITIAVCQSLHIRGSILFGIFASAGAALFLGQITLTTPFGLPPDPMPVVGKIDVFGVFMHLHALFPLVLVLLFMQVFDTLGTVVGVAAQANIITGDQLPKVEKVFTADALATMVGAVGGHSTITTYIESIAGVESGGRTGLTAVATGLCFLAALFFTPFFMMIGSYPPITAAALVIVGAMMMKNVTYIDWHEPSEAVASFLILIGIPMTYSIADGITLGLIVYPLIKLLSGKGNQISWLLYVLCAVLVLYVVLKN